MQSHFVALAHRITEYIERSEGRKRANLEVDLPLEGVEIGVDRGNLSEFLLRHFPKLTLHMVDPWSAYPLESRYRETGDRRSHRRESQWGRILRQVKRRTAFAKERRVLHQMLSLEAAPKIEDKSLDFIFIDGDHCYESVTEDIHAWLPKLKSGGLFGGHDWDNPRCGKIRDGVQRAVEECFVEAQQTIGCFSIELDVGLTWWYER